MALVRHFTLWLGLLTLAGCQFLPTLSQQPAVHNPFPQLTKVAVAPFFNHSPEPTVDGRQFAMAYYNELQVTPGFEVVAVPVVEQTMAAYGIQLRGPQDARKLAQLLEVDAVVVGAVTDFTPYYPPRCGMQVEWYSANPGFHPIPPGYGLPWGTPAEEDIPPSLVFEAQRSLAREQMKTQEPAYREEPRPQPLPQPFKMPLPETMAGDEATASDEGATKLASNTQPIVATDPNVPTGTTGTGLPPDWPDPRGFAPLPPSAQRPPLQESLVPVMSHTRTYNGADANVTEALETYVYFRDDARFGGWQSYLQRSEDFIRFCCHMHIAEMLTARGGAGETRVVWRWQTGR